MTWKLFEIDPPRKWRAGVTGDGSPFYFRCCQCEAKAPEMKGFITSNEDGDPKDLASIGLIREPGSSFLKPAMLCAECFEKFDPETLTKG